MLISMSRLMVGLMACASFWAEAASTIDSVNKFAYGANTGWQDWRGDTTNGVVIGEYVCSGSIFAANLGWIGLGSGSPTNGIRYQNNFATDFGVNHDGLGNLRGYAYGANIGWVNFETNGNPRVDLKTGALSGYAYSANCGWISLSNASAYVQSNVIQPGTDSDGDGIADAWELTYTNSLAAFSASSDTDGDGASDLAEYFADTSPLTANDNLRIIAYSPTFAGGNETNMVTWTSKETRFYRLGYETNLVSGSLWVNATAFLAPDPGSTTTRMLPLGAPLSQRLLRVEVAKPLAP